MNFTPSPNILPQKCIEYNTSTISKVKERYQSTEDFLPSINGLDDLYIWDNNNNNNNNNIILTSHQPQHQPLHQQSALSTFSVFCNFSTTHNIDDDDIISVMSDFSDIFDMDDMLFITNNIPDNDNNEPTEKNNDDNDDNNLLSMPNPYDYYHRENHKHCIILDWDDTLLASTFLAKSAPLQNDLLVAQLKPELKKIENSLILFLDIITRYGNVFIVTSSQTGWVELTCKTYIPVIWNFIQYLPIISARSEYEDEQNVDSYAWKYKAFEKCITPNYTNLISMGDSHHDHQVAWDVGKKVKNVNVKTFQFKIHPTIDELCQQLSSATKYLPDVYAQPLDMNIVLSPKKDK